MTIITIWHNNVGRPFPCLGLPNGYAGRSGISPFSPDDPETVAEFVHTIERYGAAILTDSRTIRPIAHNVSGGGTDHNDAEWCESRFEEGSQAAWYENQNRWYSVTEVIQSRATNPRNYL